MGTEHVEAWAGDLPFRCVLLWDSGREGEHRGGDVPHDAATPPGCATNTGGEEAPQSATLGCVVLPFNALQRTLITHRLHKSCF